MVLRLRASDNILSLYQYEYHEDAGKPLSMGLKRIPNSPHCAREGGAIIV